MGLFHELHAAGNTIVLITHDNEVAGEAERKIHIRDGMVTEVEKDRTNVYNGQEKEGKDGNSDR